MQGKMYIFHSSGIPKRRLGHFCVAVNTCFSVYIPVAFQLRFYHCPEVMMLHWELLGIRLPFGFFPKPRRPIISDPSYAPVHIFPVSPRAPALQGPEWLYPGTAWQHLASRLVLSGGTLQRVPMPSTSQAQVVNCSQVGRGTSGHILYLSSPSGSILKCYVYSCSRMQFCKSNSQSHLVVSSVKHQYGGSQPFRAPVGSFLPAAPWQCTLWLNVTHPLAQALPFGEPRLNLSSRKK